MERLLLEDIQPRLDGWVSADANAFRSQERTRAVARARRVRYLTGRVCRPPALLGLGRARSHAHLATVA